MGDGDDEDRLISIGRALSEVLRDNGGTWGSPTPALHRAPRDRPRASGVSVDGDGIPRSQARRFPRNGKELRIDQLIGLLITVRGITDEVRLRCVYFYWRQIVGEKIAARTKLDSISDGVLTIFVESSVWMHEVRFFKAKLIEQINGWVETQRRWLGPGPFASDLRFVLGVPREPLVDPEQLRRLIRGSRQRLRPPGREPPEPLCASSPERNAILAETHDIQDPALRQLVEDVRTRWHL